MAKKRKNSAFELGGFPFPIDSKLDEALRRVVSEVLSSIPQEPGVPITYSINIRVDENGVPAAMQPAAGKATEAATQAASQPADARNPMVEVIEREKSVTVIAEVLGADKRSLRVRAAPTRLEIRTKGKDLQVGTVNAIALPAEVDASSAKARFANGVLEVILAKGKGPAARTVKVG